MTFSVQSVCCGAAFSFFVGSVFAQEDVKARLDKLEAETRSLKEELESKKKNPDFNELFSKLHFHGYGEVHYNNPARSETTTRGDSEIDFHRLVLGWTYDFSDSIRFDAEVEFEHAGKEIELEYAQVEFDLAPEHSFRVGALLMPFGPLNEMHEPPNYYSVERSYLESFVTPTTWQELGAGFAGRLSEQNLNYRLYVVNGFDASRFNALEGVRGGRGLEDVEAAKTEDFAVVGRLEHSPTPELTLGISGYYGGADQGGAGLGRVLVGMYEADARLRLANFELKGEFVNTRVTNADNISLVVGETVGRVMQGWSAELDCHALSWIDPESKRDLVIFARREDFDTNQSVPSGFPRDPAAERGIWTFGAAYYPVPKLAIKADYERWRDGNNDQLGRFNLGVGWMF